MTRPEIVRADTLDLQDPLSPSAKDHSRQPASPKPLGDGPPAPHQAQSLRKASLEGYDLNVRSPRGSKDLSDKELQLLHDGEGEDHDGMGDGGHDHDGEDMGIDEDDDDLDDDDMMDKISSSPSIDDGGYKAQPAWPLRGDSLLHLYHHHHQSSVRRTRQANETTARPIPMLRPSRNRDVASASAKRFDQPASVPPRKSIREDQATRHPKKRTLSTKVSRFKENFKGLPATIHEEEEEMAPSPDDRLRDLLVDPDVYLSDEGYSSELDNNPGSPDLDSDSEHSSVDTPSVDDDDPRFWEDERFVDSGWGGECLREIEDIDFEFVYALHTFVATVEGQANATKGDTMVLLDDSNSYWWLVKVVKDSSIGYLPAEHIETPTERLARLNKHRNIDLSQTMLGDNPEKSRNPLKIAMRRRNAKTVQFTDPIYYEPSEPSYSSDEEEDDLMSPMGQQAQAQAQSQAHQQNEQQLEDETAAVEPLRPSRAAAGEDAGKKSLDSEATQVDSEKPRSSQDTLDSRDEEGTGKRRVRNTDSFYKDESVETIKKSLTPNILKEESSTSVIEDSRASLDSQKSNEKAAAKDEKPKKEKEKKKSGGMLGGLFKRKNSKSKHEKEEDKDDLGLMASPKASSDSTSHDSTPPAAAASPQNQKQGKLQKAQKSNTGSKRGKEVEDKAQAAKHEPVVADVPHPESETRDLAREPAQEQRGAPAPLRLVPSDEKPAASNTVAEPKSPGASKGGLFSPIEKVQTMLHSGSNSKPAEPKPEKTKKAKNRMALEDSDASEDEPAAVAPLAAAAPAAAPLSARQQPAPVTAPLRPAPQPLETSMAARPERLSESPIEVSPVASTSHLVPGGLSSSHLDVPPSPVSAVSTPELVERPSESDVTRSAPTHAPLAKPAHAAPTQRSIPPATTKTPDINATPSTSTMSSPVTAPTTPQWSPAALRAYIETDGAADVRDLMLLIHDTSDVKSLPQHHDVVRGFDGEQKKLDGMHKRLDNLLDEVLKRNALPMSII